MKYLISTLLTFLLIIQAFAFDETLWSQQNPDDRDWPGGGDIHDVVVAGALDPTAGGASSVFFAVGDQGIIQSASGLAGSWDPVSEEVNGGLTAILAASFRTLDGRPFSELVAVGANGRVVVQRGTLDPNVVTVSGAGNFTGIASGQVGTTDANVIVDDRGNIYSGRSANYTRRLAGEGIAWRGVAFGNGVWVAVGDDSRSAISTDGENWQVLENAVSNFTGSFDFKDVEFGGDSHLGRTFVAVGDRGIISTSNHGLNWTVQRVAAGEDFTNVDFLPIYATWIVSGGEGTIWRSSDGGNTFEREVLPNLSRIQAVAATSSRMVFLGAEATGFTYPASFSVSQRQFDFEDDGGSQDLDITIEGLDNVPWGISNPAGSNSFASISPTTGSGSRIVPVNCALFDLIDTRTTRVFINNILINIVQNGGDNPLPPEDVEAEVISATSIRLFFNPPEGANRYVVSFREAGEADFTARNPVQGGFIQELGNYVDIGDLRPDTPYELRVQAVKVNDFEAILGISKPSDTVMAMTRLAGATDLRVEPLRTDLEDRSAGYKGFQISWDLVPGASSYLLRRAKGMNGAFSDVSDIEGDQSSYIDLIDDLDFLDLYRYQIITTAGDRTTVVVQLPPRGLRVQVEPIQTDPEDQSAGYEGFQISWDLAPGTSSYRLRRAKGINGSFSDVANIEGDQFSYDDLIDDVDFLDLYRYRMITTSGEVTDVTVELPRRGVRVRILDSQVIDFPEPLQDVLGIQFEIGKMFDQFTTLGVRELEMEYRRGVNGEWIRYDRLALKSAIAPVDDSSPSVEDEEGLWTHTGVVPFELGQPITCRFRLKYGFNNPVYSQWTTTRTLCIERPEPVQNLQLSSRTETALRLAWQPRSDIESYQIDVRSDGTQVRILSVPGLSTFVNIEGLSSGTEYEVRIRGAGAEDVSCISEWTTIMVSTLARGPIRVRATVLDDESVQVTWVDFASIRPGAIIQSRSYNPLTGPPNGTNTGWQQARNVVGNDRVGIVDGLNPSLTHQFRVAVRATTGELLTGFSAPSNSIDLPPAAPEIRFIEMLSNGDAGLRWRIRNRSFLTQMIVQRANSENGSYTTVDTVELDQPLLEFGSVELRGLEQLRNYYYRIAVRDQFGMQSEFTEPELLHVPLQLEITPFANSIVLKWQETPGIETWQLERSVDGAEGTFEVISLLDGETVKFEDFDVSDTKIYHYRIHPKGGIPGFSETQVAVTQPARPFDLLARIEGENISLKWSSGGPFDVFQVEWRSGRSGSYTLIGTTTEKVFVHTAPQDGINQYRIRSARQGFRSSPSTLAEISIDVPLGIELLGITVEDEDVTLRFRGVAGEKYFYWTSFDLKQWVPSRDSITATGEIETITLFGAANSEAKFWRISE